MRPSGPTGADRRPSRGVAAAAARRPALALTVALGAVGLILAGCSSGPSASPTTSSTTSGSASTTTGGASTTTGGASTSTSSGSTTTTAGGSTTTTTGHATLQTCQVGQLAIVPQQGQGAAGTIELSVNLTNRAAACTLYGYPGMQLLGSGGASLPTNVVRGGGAGFTPTAANGPPRTVTLQPQATAAFSMSYSDVPVGSETSCPTSVSAEITPPGNYHSGIVPLSVDACGGGTIHVSPVYPLSS